MRRKYEVRGTRKQVKTKVAEKESEVIYTSQQL